MMGDETEQTIESISIITNIHNCFSQYYGTTKTLNLLIHCSTTKVYRSMKQHRTQLYSLKQCLLPDWDKLQEISNLHSFFRFVRIIDTTTELIVSHTTILQEVSNNLHNPIQSTVNPRPISQFPQLQIKGQMITNKHIINLREQSREQVITIYLRSKNDWTNDTFASISWWANKKLSGNCEDDNENRPYNSYTIVFQPTRLIPYN